MSMEIQSKKLMVLGIVFMVILFISGIVTAVVNEKNTKRIDYVHKLKPSPTIKKSGETCYSFLGAKWPALPVKYVINPSNSQGLSRSFIKSAISTSAETWDKVIGKELFNDNFVVDISAVPRVRDGKNTLGFGFYPSNSIVALTSVWVSQEGEILEADTLFNTALMFGDAAINPNVLDLQSIATHELGHVIGLGDIYSSSCTAVTMYGVSFFGDINKRTLERADIRGIRKLY